MRVYRYAIRARILLFFSGFFFLFRFVFPLVAAVFVRRHGDRGSDGRGTDGVSYRLGAPLDASGKAGNQGVREDATNCWNEQKIWRQMRD